MLSRQRKSRDNENQYDGERFDSSDPFGDLLGDSNFPSVIKELVHPGETPDDLLMRCYLNNEQQANAAVLFMHKCDEFGLEKAKKLLLMKLAASVSIGGQARLELIQAHAKVISNQLNRRRGISIGKNRKADDEQ